MLLRLRGPALKVGGATACRPLERRGPAGLQFHVGVRVPGHGGSAACQGGPAGCAHPALQDANLLLRRRPLNFGGHRRLREQQGLVDHREAATFAAGLSAAGSRKPRGESDVIQVAALCAAGSRAPRPRRAAPCGPHAPPDPAEPRRPPAESGAAAARDERDPRRVPLSGQPSRADERRAAHRPLRRPAGVRAHRRPRRRGRHVALRHERRPRRLVGRRPRGAWRRPRRGDHRAAAYRARRQRDAAHLRLHRRRLRHARRCHGAVGAGRAARRRVLLPARAAPARWRRARRGRRFALPAAWAGLRCRRQTHGGERGRSGTWHRPRPSRRRDRRHPDRHARRRDGRGGRHRPRGQSALPLPAAAQGGQELPGALCHARRHVAPAGGGRRDGRATAGRQPAG
mmetsp:Transcript_25020/g.67121  ORF Transcript_25020/g.67121 Transcript_25020/m.67121 type:complete len:400 (-) Transcript_25020:156-1355(-)